MVGLRPTLSTTNCANQSPASATCPGPSFSIFTPGDAVAFHFFDRIAVAIVIESICDRVDSNSWTVPRSRQFVDTEHPGGRSQFPDCRPPCKSFVKGEKDSPDARLGGARTIEAIRTRSSHVCLSAVVSCLRRTGHPFTVSGPCGPSQKIECVFSASPETIRREPREFDLRRSVGNRRTWQSARCVILLFFRRGGPRFLGRYAPRICERYEIALPSIDGEQISHHFPSNGQRRSIGIPFLLFSFIDQSQSVILPRCQLRGLHQHTLDMLVALFRKGCAGHLVGRLFSSPQSPQ